MRVLFVTPEVYPLAKTGGLADASSGLVKALSHLGCDVRVLMPAYSQVFDRLASAPLHNRALDINHPEPVSLLTGFIPETAIPIWFVRSPRLYERPGGPYQDSLGRDWPDNEARFGLLCRAAAAAARDHVAGDWRPDIVHLNDWPAGPAACLFAREERARPKTVFTIHNMAFQGLFARNALDATDLGQGTFTPDGLEFWGRVSFLKAGIRYADRVTTVSETYAREIMTPEFGCGLEGVLRARPDGVMGIRNGIDTREWNPRTDRLLPANYTAEDLRGKAACKASARHRFGLDREDDVPLLVYASRLTDQKMADVVAAAVPDIIARGCQMIVMGRGECAVEAAFEQAAVAFPGRLGVHVGYDEGLARLLIAAADILLAPARFEPCGLNQMYAMRYGSVPVVTRVGGLAETVTDADTGALASGTATGVVFDGASVGDLLAAVDRTLTLYRQPPLWRALIRNGMRADWSWEKSAHRYVDVYRGLHATADTRISGAVHPAQPDYRRRLPSDTSGDAKAARDLASLPFRGGIAKTGKGAGRSKGENR